MSPMLTVCHDDRSRMRRGSAERATVVAVTATATDARK
jgi:hypothetical protein